MYTYSFEKLEVWKKARLLTVKIYRVTRTFPEYELYGLTNQVRRSSVSICANLAEGSSRRTKKDQSHFYNIAYSSLTETLNHIIISYDLRYLSADIYDELRDNIREISFMLNRLATSTP